MSYKSEIAELARFFRAYISLDKKFRITTPDKSFRESLERNVLQPYLYQRFNVQKKYITVICVNDRYISMFDTDKLFFKVDKGIAFSIDNMWGDFTLKVLDPEKIEYRDVLYLSFSSFESTFNFLLNYDLLYSISSGNAKTKALIQHIYNVITGGIK